MGNLAPRASTWRGNKAASPPLIASSVPIDLAWSCQNSWGSLLRCFLILSVWSTVGGPSTWTRTPGSTCSKPDLLPQWTYDRFLPIVMRLSIALLLARFVSPRNESSPLNALGRLRAAKHLPRDPVHMCERGDVFRRRCTHPAELARDLLLLRSRSGCVGLQIRILGPGLHDDVRFERSDDVARPLAALGCEARDVVLVAMGGDDRVEFVAWCVP